MYPVALEKQYQKYFLQEFRQLAIPYTNEIIKKLKHEIKSDSDNTVRADSITQMMVFMADLRAEYGDKINSSEIEGKIRKNFALIDAWSRDKTNDAITKLYTRLNTPQQPSVTGRVTPKNMPGELWMASINLRKNLNEGLIDDVVKQNVGLINDAYKEHFTEMNDIVKNGILNGEGNFEIGNKLRRFTGVNESKARFWARDQASKFFGETTRLRQKEAGIPGYIWRCVGGRRTRDSHLALEGTYHNWNNPPMVQSGNTVKALHPGEDYNCRCWAEPALGPEASEKAYTGSVDDNYFETIRPGNETANFNSGSNNYLTGRTIINIDNPALKKNVNEALSSIGRLMTIDTAKVRPLTVVQMNTSDPYFINTQAYHFKSGHLAIKPGINYEKSTFIHEFFHWVDMKVLPESAGKLYTDIIKNIEKTDLCKELKSLKNFTKDSATRAHLEYMLTPTELFARSMEQYVAESGIDADITAQFSSKRIDYEKYYWIDSDFKNVYNCIEKMFKELKWK